MDKRQGAEYVARLEDALRQILAEAKANGGGDLSLAEPAWRWAGELIEATLIDGDGAHE
jgi:hypothetical protein